MGTKFYPGMEQKSQSQMEELWDLCQRFISENRIIAAYSIHQMDHVQGNAPELIEQICNIVGYTEGEGT